MFNNTTPIVLNLIIINVLVFITGGILHTTNSFLALHYIGSSEFNPIQLFTCMFVHDGWWHIFFNMIGLLLFGTILERHLGSTKFLIYYVVCGLGAHVLFSAYVYYDMSILRDVVNQYNMNPTAESFSDIFNHYSYSNFKRLKPFIKDFANMPNSSIYINQSIEYVNSLYFAKSKVQIVGASGAIYGVLLGVGIIFPFMEVFLLFPPLPLKMMYLVIFYGLTSVYGMVQNQSGDNVAHFAHLSGMIVGFVMLKIWGEKRANYY